MIQKEVSAFTPAPADWVYEIGFMLLKALQWRVYSLEIRIFSTGRIKQGDFIA